MNNVDNRMNVKIPVADPNLGSQQSGRAPGVASSGQTPTQANPGVGGDTVTFTSTAAEMLKLEESLSSIPDVDNARVASIKAAIDEGSYRIDPEKIVDSLLGLEKDLH